MEWIHIICVFLCLGNYFGVLAMKKILRVGIATRREQIGKYAGGKANGK